jgi:hypothetical protein
MIKWAAGVISIGILYSWVIIPEVGFWLVLGGFIGMLATLAAIEEKEERQHG